jgi:hypothetical protein
VAEPDKPRRRRNLDDLRTALNGADVERAEEATTPFDRAWSAGARLPIESAVSEALQVTALAGARAASPSR